MLGKARNNFEEDVQMCFAYHGRVDGWLYERRFQEKSIAFVRTSNVSLISENHLMIAKLRRNIDINDAKQQRTVNGG